MYLNPDWRILTVGDGDLSFSNALNKALKPHTLVASTYDSEATITTKYADNAFTALDGAGVSILTEFDVTQPSAWQRLDRQKFDLVIFQFPLIPAFKDQTAFEQQASANTLNRALLHQFIKYANHYALDESGPQLCYITSKDVKPYLHWNIEGSLAQGLNANYIGQMPFDITLFSGYKIRNVDRDKHVKDTSGITYVFSPSENNQLRPKLTYPNYLTDNHCALCRAGPFCFEEDQKKHFNGKKHLQMQSLENDWQQWLKNFNTEKNR